MPLPRHGRDTMATTPMGTERQERCDDCDRDTPHDVRIELRAESESPGENAAFSPSSFSVGMA